MLFEDELLKLKYYIIQPFEANLEKVEIKFAFINKTINFHFHKFKIFISENSSIKLNYDSLIDKAFFFTFIILKLYIFSLKFVYLLIYYQRRVLIIIYI